MATAESSGIASRESLQTLHRLLCEYFTGYLANTPPSKIRASMLEVIRGFLKDNNVRKDLTSARDVKASLDELAGLSIPFLPDFKQ